jgi:arsenate reductase
VFRDIKQDPLTAEELEMYQLSGVMKPCSAKAQLYKSMNLKDKSWLKRLQKIHFRALYFFEPTCFVINNGVYVGGTQQNMLQVMKALANVEEMLHCLVLQLFQ